jgi:hypothetical protein
LKTKIIFFVECRPWHSAKAPLCRVLGVQRSAKIISFSLFYLYRVFAKHSAKLIFCLKKWKLFAECPNLGTWQRPRALTLAGRPASPCPAGAAPPRPRLRPGGPLLRPYTARAPRRPSPTRRVRARRCGPPFPAAGPYLE